MPSQSTVDPSQAFENFSPALKRAVRLFKAWADEDPANAAMETTSMHQLFNEHLAKVADIVPDRDGEGPHIVQRQRVAEALTLANTRNHPWWALCYWALQLYQDDYSAPNALRYFANEYAKRLGWPIPDTPPNVDETAFDHVDPERAATEIATLKDRLREYSASARADVADITRAAARLAVLLSAGLQQSPGGDSAHRLDEAGVETATEIADLAQMVVVQVDTVADRPLTDADRRHCALVFDAAIQARRRLARVPGSEDAQFGLLGILRTDDMRITNPIRTNVEQAFMRYYREHSEALLRGGDKNQPRAEFNAALRLVDKLHTINGDGPGLQHERLNGQRPRVDNVVDIEKLIGVACRVACLLAATPSIADQSAKLRRRLLNLLPPSQDRNDVRWLLALAVSDDSVILNPAEILRVARVRGVGDYLLARMFVAASNTDDSAVDFLRRSQYRYFQPDEADLLRRVARLDEKNGALEPAAETLRRLRDHRQGVILQRAAGLYDRALVWLRNSGSSGALRRRAEDELQVVHTALARREIAVERDPASVVHALSGLRHRLDEMIVDGFLWADINAMTNMNDNAVLFAGRRLSAVLDQAQRYLIRPELGVVAET